MNDISPPVRDVTSLHPGDAIGIRDAQGFHRRGTVEETAPHLRVVWVRETGTGERHLVTEDECYFQH